MTGTSSFAAHRTAVGTNASEKLKEVLEVGQPDPQTLMRFMLAGFSAHDIAAHFDRALRNITGAPMPDEADTWVFSPEFETAP